MDTNYDYDEVLRNATQEMHDAEDALIESGFSQEQWVLIKKYVLSAILYSDANTAKILGSIKIDPTA